MRARLIRALGCYNVVTGEIMSLLKKIKFTTAGQSILILLACLSLGYWWVSGHVWFRIDNHKVSINGRSLAEGGDYSCFKSLAGDIFCYHQDHGTQYFISPRNNEVSAISESAGVGYLEVILISGGARNGFEDSGVKQRLSDTQLTIGNGFIEFTPSITEWKSHDMQRWNISY